MTHDKKINNKNGRKQFCNLILANISMKCSLVTEDENFCIQLIAIPADSSNHNNPIQIISTSHFAVCYVCYIFCSKTIK